MKKKLSKSPEQPTVLPKLLIIRKDFQKYIINQDEMVNDKKMIK